MNRYKYNSYFKKKKFLGEGHFEGEMYGIKAPVMHWPMEALLSDIRYTEDGRIIARLDYGIAEQINIDYLDFETYYEQI